MNLENFLIYLLLISAFHYSNTIELSILMPSII